MLVIVVTGILAAVVLPKITSIGFDARGYADQVHGALQYARNTAVAQRRYVCVSVGGGTVSLAKSSSYPLASISCPTALLNPTSGSTFDISAPSGVSVGASSSPLYFDALGQNVDSSGNPATSDVTVTITGDFSATITVEKVTGYVR